MEGHVPDRLAERCREILAQHILAGSLRTGKQKVPARKKDRECHLPGLFAVIIVLRLRDSVSIFLAHRVSAAEFFHSPDKISRHTFLSQKIKNITHSALLLSALYRPV